MKTESKYSFYKSIVRATKTWKRKIFAVVFDRGAEQLDACFELNILASCR